jgi:hypothetical protein
LKQKQQLFDMALKYRLFDSLRQSLFEKKVQPLITIDVRQAMHTLDYNLKIANDLSLDVHSRLSVLIILPFDDTQPMPFNKCQIFQERTDNFPLPM